MKNVLVIIVLILVVIALYNVFIYMKQGISVSSGGIGSLFKLPYSIPKGYQGSVSSSPATAGITSTPPPVVGGGQGSAPSAPKPSVTPPEGFTAAQLSPWYGQIKISGVSPSGSWNGTSQFTLGANGTLQEGIDITGWEMKSNKGDLLIPGAIANYTPGGFAVSGDITLTTGTYATLYSSASPIGKNVRLNECIGYLNNIYKFDPSLPSNCPSMYNRSEIATFSGQCQNLIFSLGSCAAPTPAQWNSVAGEPECQSFLNRFNYSNCYWKHVSEANFFSNEWRGWLGTPFLFDPSHDRILLLDKNGLLVDQYVY